MIIRPVFNILLLPDITYFFKRDFFPGAAADQIEVGTDILFPFLKNEVDETTVTIDDIYPVGMSARVESIGDDDSIQIRTLERVSLDDIELDENGQITATASIRPEVDDLPLEEEKQTFTNLRNSLLKFVQNYQWGIWARSYIIQRKNIYDLGSALSDYLNITSEEKYAIVETDSRRERCELIENAIKEFMEVAKVSSEAQEAQKGDQEQLYREVAIKKQIDYLQKELDEMHPENISDVRAFEKKIQESGMNEDARKEADKVLNRMKQEGKDSHEYGLLYDYLDFVTSLSWKHPEFTPIDLNRAEEILDEDHYGLKKVKERIIQQIAVMALNRKQHGSILLFVGAPGTGKSYRVSEEIKHDYIADYSSKQGSPDVFRATLHPEYSYSDFVGQLLPKVEQERVTYEFTPGVFTSALKHAISYPMRPTFLILEEMSRANVAAVFGDIFQLLDRDEDGRSEYTINNGLIAQNAILSDADGATDPNSCSVYLPENLFIVGTVNTSDQNVFAMDTAFKRRFTWEYVSPKVDEASFENNPDIEISSDMTVSWYKLYTTLNDFITRDLGLTEDKQIGPYFIKFGHSQMNPGKLVKDKLLQYLWEDVDVVARRMNGGARSLFDSKIASFADLYDSFGQKTVFSNKFIEKLNGSASNDSLDESDDADGSERAED